MREAGAVFLAFAALGMWGLAPSVSFGDSGELIASAATLAIPHAPGYPLFCLAARALGELLRLGSWAYRANLLSALGGAAALALLYDAARRGGAGRLGAAAGTLFLGLSPLWLHTTQQTEVFALNCLCAAGALWVVCRFGARAFDPRPMAALGLCLGLGGANHQTLALAAPALLWEAWARSRPDAGKAARGLVWLLAFAGLGLCLYLYLPLRARAFPPLDWGHPADLQRFLHVLLRRDYGSFSLTVEGAAGSRLAGLLPQSLRYARAAWAELGPAGLGLVLLGLATWRAAPAGPSWRLPAALALLAGPGFLALGNPPFDAQTSGALGRFYLLSWLGIFFLIARGADELSRLWRPGAWAALAAPLLAAALSAPSWCQRWDLAAHDYGRNVLRSLPPGARLFMDGGDDTFYTVAYLQQAEGLRPDLDPRDRGGLVFRSPYGPDFRLLDKEQKEQRRLLVEEESARERPTFYSTLKDRLLPGRPLLAWGLLRRVGPFGRGLPEGLPLAPPEGRGLWSLYPLRLSREQAAGHYRYRALMAIYPVMRAVADTALGEWGRTLLWLEEAARLGPDVLWVPGAAAQRAQWVGYLASERREWAAAEKAYRLAARLMPEDASAWTNLGVALEKGGRLAEAEAAYRRGLGLSGHGAQAYANLGSLYWTMGRWREAAAMFDEAARRDPANAAYKSFRDKALARGRS